MKIKPQRPPKRFWEDDHWAQEHYQTLLECYPHQWVAILNKAVVAAHEDLKILKKIISKKTKSIVPVLYVEDASHVYAY